MFLAFPAKLLKTDPSFPDKSDFICSFPTISDLIITGNTSHDSGGGIAINNCSPTIINTIIFSNHANIYGGGIYINGDNANPNIIDCEISENWSGINGGGLYFYDNRCILL